MTQPCRSYTVLSLVLLGAMTELAMPWGSARAQDAPRWEVAAGATHVRTSNVVEGSSTGWMIGGGWSLNDWLAVELQLDRFDQSQTVTFLDIDARFRSVLLGPRVTWRDGPFQPFGRMLVGRTQVDLTVTSRGPFLATGNSVESDGTLQLGGGIHIPIPIVARPHARLTYDYRRIFAVEAINQHGLAAGIVYGIVGF